MGEAKRRKQLDPTYGKHNLKREVAAALTWIQTAMQYQLGESNQTIITTNNDEGYSLDAARTVENFLKTRNDIPDHVNLILMQIEGRSFSQDLPFSDCEIVWSRAKKTVKTRQENERSNH